jgi:hypothetical protein
VPFRDSLWMPLEAVDTLDGKASSRRRWIPKLPAQLVVPHRLQAAAPAKIDPFALGQLAPAFCVVCEERGVCATRF